MKVRSTISETKTVTVVLALAGLVMAASLALVWTPVQAQGGSTPVPTQGSPITFSGTVESVGPRFIVVNGLMVDLQNAAGPLNRLQLGAPVTIVGTLQNSVVQATLVQLGDDDDDDTGSTNPPPVQVVTSTPAPASGANPPASRRDGARRIVVQGPVSRVTPTSLRVFDLDIAIDDDTVLMTNVNVGDNVRIDGDFTITNNVFQITAVNVTRVSPNAFRGSDDTSNRDSGSTSGSQAPVNPAPQTSDRDSNRISDSASNRTSDSTSDRSSGSTNSQPAPPPPPPSMPDSDRDSGNDSAVSSRSS